MCDVVSVLVEADTNCIPRFSHVLEITGKAADKVHTISRVKISMAISGENVPIVPVSGPRDKVIKIRESVDSGLRQGA